MKRTITILAGILFIMAGCEGNKQATDDLITVDVTANYPKKELILQDFMDVEYVPLETNDEFICQGFVQDIGKNVVIARNYNNDGNIFLFDRNGKALRKINHQGQSGKEYSHILGITLDEDNGEIFVNDIFTKKILVYDLFGNFRRSFKHKEGDGSLFYTDIFNYDKDHLICYDPYNKEIAFILISKQDGSIAKEIKIPFKEKKAAVAIRKDKTSGMTYSVSPGPYRTIIPFKGNWMLLELSSDTVYSFLPDYSLRPFLVRTPSIESMQPEVFLILRLFSDRYYFMETIKNEYNFNTNRGFERTYFMYDRQEKTFSGYTIYNGDYSTKEEIYMSGLRPVNHEIESWQSLEAYQLVEAYEKGKLKGKLKEIASKLDEESNPVIMLVKHKK
ncbi:6-bladed beta-propeller [Parabacteroides bouchesdurhonensis]|uniref:6-bladed beta-propeller n=1 Tax=Parabacteroides bouchesdurhonensis TaxID=1936995 RepID=UPI000E547B2D|nr:6-bladed beta-propeller [Parabacteroides bouchesdurhonensis]RHJ91164.1 6-bladed beta-propeller [Bacteroides sp. AM07-16]